MRGDQNSMGVNVYPTGSLVRVANYSPYGGMRGTICSVDTISDELEEPFCFYLVDLEGAQLREPMWFEYDEVEVVTAPLAAFWRLATRVRKLIATQQKRRSAQEAALQAFLGLPHL
jgi:hypothetical protein